MILHRWLTGFLLWAGMSLCMQIHAQENLHTWGKLDYKGNPWVTPLSRPMDITQGLQGRHLTVWASHGNYYDFNKGCWQWQRPRLYCTTEDIFTQSFVVPFLIPMLENAGAIVFTPRERDWQREERVVDNDMDTPDGLYIETNGTYEWQTGGKGFRHYHDILFDHEQPFETGTVRKVEAQPHKRQLSQIVWQPRLAKAGRYAVYVSYSSLPTSVSDAEYTVRHRGISTKFRVNQQMGGGTWVYLGTFDFSEGCSQDNCVMLSNLSNYRGVVTADAVRFGGGMGNVARGDSLHTFVRSGLPRFLEGSRYYAQWAGMPYSVYGNKQSTSDYAEDINTRSLMSNRLARGSVFLPGDSGLCVPIELSLAVHSDAGLRTDTSHVGTLGIHTTGINTAGEYEGLLAEGLLPSGRSRFMSGDLCNAVMSQVLTDLQQVCSTWCLREIYDRNYSETRLPEVPSMILETLSHQNFADIRHGHDPSFKILLSRAIYKGLLKYVAGAHGLPSPVVQPLPVQDFAAELTPMADSVSLSWQPTTDPTETSAYPDSYIVYISEGEKGFDNGHLVYGNRAAFPVRCGTLTRFVVRAANSGGLSLPSEELCVYAARQERNRLLIVNAFTRLAAPQPIDTDSTRGFDMNIDPGVVYQHSPSFCGQQTSFWKEGFGGQGTTQPTPTAQPAEELGTSGNELEGMLVAGNTFDYPTQHAQAFLLADTTLSIASCSKTALEKGAIARGYNAIDLILGAQRADGYSINATRAFSPALYSCLSNFTSQGGALLVSGAYIGEEIDEGFAQRVLHCSPSRTYALDDASSQLTGLNTSFSIQHEPNEDCYAVRRLTSLYPATDAFPLVASPTRTQCLSVAYQGTAYRCLTYGFPLECIRETGVRKAVLAASLSFLLPH